MISNYAGLLTALADRMDRDDLASRVDNFIQLTEAKLNRLLRDPEMEVTVTLNAAGDFTDLPDDFGEMVSISTGDGPLHQVGSVEYAGLNDISGTPRHYVIQDGQIGFAPRDASVAITLVYRRRIPALTSTNTTNWLLTLAPDAYLYGCLMQASAWDHDEERAAMWKGEFEQVIAELRTDGDRRKWGAGPISPRINRS